jgi:hypothetical protein
MAIPGWTNIADSSRDGGFVGWVRRALRRRWPFALHSARAVTHRLAVAESVGYAAPRRYRGLETRCLCAANPPYETLLLAGNYIFHYLRVFAFIRG